MKLIQKLESGGSVEMDIPNDANLSVVLDNFESFLKACGYQFDGHLDFLNCVDE